MNDNNDKKQETIKKIQKLKDQLENANQKVEELTDSTKRAMADLQNFKKRMEEDKKQFAKFASANVFLEILPVFDSFERAQQHVPDELKDNEWVKGIEGIIKQFEQIMDKFNIKKMKSVGEKFDPNRHEAVASEEGEKDVVLEELEAGYMMDDYVLRAAKVKVGSGQ
jgi:molecular chaperone GrpE